MYAGIIGKPCSLQTDFPDFDCDADHGIYETGDERTHREATEMLDSALDNVNNNEEGLTPAERKEQLESLREYAKEYGLDTSELNDAEAQNVLDSFYGESAETTDERIQALKDAGYDTTELEEEINGKREALRKAQAEKEAETPQYESYVDYLTSDNGPYNDKPGQNDPQYDSYVDYLTGDDGPYSDNPGQENETVDQDYLDNVNNVAEDILSEDDVKPGYPDYNDIQNGVPQEPGQTSDTWCNRALYRMLNGLNADPSPLVDPTDGIGYTDANEMTQNARNASEDPNSGVRSITAEEAQELANNGQPVIAAWENPGGHGHVALVVPDEEYDDDKGPHITQAGGSNYDPSAGMHVSDTFTDGWEAYNDEESEEEPIELFVLEN